MNMDSPDRKISLPPASDTVTVQPKTMVEAPGGELSRFVFSNPREFLATLSADVHQMSRSARTISADELKEFAADPNNTLPERAAAEIAANHYNQLVDMAGIPWGSFDFTRLTPDVLLDLENGSTGTLKAELATGDVVGVLAGAGMSVVLGGITAAIAEGCPPAAVATGAGAVAMAGFAVDSWSHLRRDSAAIDELVSDDKKIFASWNEINGQHQ